MTVAAPAIECRGVSKLYRRYSRRRKFQTLKSALIGGELLRGIADADAIHALERLDLLVPKGEALGIVGGNGSGKSTLMKMIYGTTKPTTGVIRTDGRISALIELGAGFHPEISGRENVTINGIMLGLSRREIARRYEEIVAFAELQDFMDAPVKTYSSGMYARLGFAVAISVRPDILLVDEVLAVGDEEFSHKCVERIGGLKAEGKTLVLVTHDLAMVEKLCDRALWLRAGRLMEEGEPRRVIDAYRMDVARQEEARLGAEHRQAESSLGSELVGDPSAAPSASKGEEATLAVAKEDAGGEETKRWGTLEAEIASVTLTGRDGEPRHVFDPGEPFEIRLRVVAKKALEDFVFGVGIFSADGSCVYGTNTSIERFRPERLEGTVDVAFAIERLDLCEGTYRLDVAVHRENGAPYDYQRGLYTFRVNSDQKDVGVYRPRHAWRFGEGVRFEK